MRARESGERFGDKVRSMCWTGRCGMRARASEGGPVKWERAGRKEGGRERTSGEGESRYS